MKVVSSRLQAVAVASKQYPEDDLPEIAFAGRSNVGKSSFINAMLSRRNLARTSGTPGKTRTVNFYIFNEAYRFVDLPGYGYAKISRSEQEKWADIINKYLSTRENLKEVVLIVDIRHEPSAQDVMMYEWMLNYGFTGYVIATKMDKIGKNERQKNLTIIRKKLNVADPALVLPFSSEKKTEVEKTWKRMEGIFGKNLDEV